MASLSGTQRTTVRNAFIAVSADYRGTATAVEWADQQMATLDAFRAGIDRSYYDFRYRPWMVANLGFTTAIRTAIDNHARGL